MASCKYNFLCTLFGLNDFGFPTYTMEHSVIEIVRIQLNLNDRTKSNAIERSVSEGVLLKCPRGSGSGKRVMGNRKKMKSGNKAED